MSMSLAGGTKSKKNWISGAVGNNSHPVVNAAKRKGISTHAEAEIESKSKNPHVRGRGLLALRFERGIGKK